MNFFALPDGNVQIAFSGGRTSAFMLHQILEANGDLPDRVQVTFQNTGRERPETLDFVAECGRRWGVMITWLEYRAEKPLFAIVGHQGASRNGEPFDALIRRKKALPNQFQKWCSAELKTLTARRWCMRDRGWKAWTSAIGFRADELHRKPYIDRRIRPWLPLRDSAVTRHDVMSFWAGQSFDLQLPIARGVTIGGNCDGCFLKSEAALAALCRDYPSRAAWWEHHETSIGHGFSKRFRRGDLRAYVEKQGDWIFDTEGALCQKDDGECTE